MAFETLTHSKTEKGKESYVPQFENFSAEQEQWIKNVLNLFGLPLSTIKRFRYVDSSQDPNVGTAAYWDGGKGEIVIRGPLRGEGASYELTRTLFHELTHAVLDPVSYLVRDEVTMLPKKDAQGNYQFSPTLFSLFPNRKSLQEFQQFQVLSFVQAYETNTYLDGYQDLLGSKYKELTGARHILLVQLSISSNTPERNRQLQHEMREVQEKIDVLTYTLMAESWAISMTMAFLNPRGLKQKVNAQKGAWESMGLSENLQVLDGGEKRTFVDTYTQSQKLLRGFFKTNQGGLEKKRADLKKYLQSEPFPQ